MIFETSFQQRHTTFYCAWMDGCRAEASEAVEQRDAFAVKASRYVPWNKNLHGAMDPLHLMELKGEVFESCEIYPDVVEFCPCGDEACLAWGTTLAFLDVCRRPSVENSLVEMRGSQILSAAVLLKRLKPYVQVGTALVPDVEARLICSG